MTRYNYKKEYVWNEDISYIAGLIASDGCLYNDGRHINFTSKDIELVKALIEILHLKSKISLKQSGFGTWAYFVQFSDVSLYDFLASAGIGPAKSKTIHEVLVPTEYFGDFLRGYFDGDGTVYATTDRRYPNAFLFYIAYASASRVFLEWIQSMNVLAGAGKGSIKRSTRVFVLSYSKQDAGKLWEIMYDSRSRYFLQRKREKLRGFLDRHTYGSIDSYARVAELVDASD